MPGRVDSCGRVHRQLAEYGALLLQDKVLPSIVGIFAGPLSTSWWNHPKAQAIFECVNAIESDEAITTRLLMKKVTFVHRRMYPALLTVGSAEDDWQLRGLSDEAKGLLRKVTREGRLTFSGKVAKELEERLLVTSEQTHTPSGHHENVLESWNAWGARMKVKPLASVERARASLESVADAFEAPPRALPWRAGKGRR